MIVALSSGGVHAAPRGRERNLAAQFAGATCVPISELGVVHDNPSSAEAIYAAKEALVVEVDATLNAANAE